MFYSDFFGKRIRLKNAVTENFYLLISGEMIWIWFSNWELIIGSWAKNVLYTMAMCMLTNAAYTKKNGQKSLQTVKRRKK